MWQHCKLIMIDHPFQCCLSTFFFFFKKKKKENHDHIEVCSIKWKNYNNIFLKKKKKKKKKTLNITSPKALVKTGAKNLELTESPCRRPRSKANRGSLRPEPSRWRAGAKRSTRFFDSSVLRFFGWTLFLPQVFRKESMPNSLFCLATRRALLVSECGCVGFIGFWIFSAGHLEALFGVKNDMTWPLLVAKDPSRSSFCRLKLKGKAFQQCGTLAGGLDSGLRINFVSQVPESLFLELDPLQLRNFVSGVSKWFKIFIQVHVKRSLQQTWGNHQGASSHWLQNCQTSPLPSSARPHFKRLPTSSIWCDASKWHHVDKSPALSKMSLLSFRLNSSLGLKKAISTGLQHHPQASSNVWEMTGFWWGWDSKCSWCFFGTLQSNTALEKHGKT